MSSAVHNSALSLGTPRPSRSVRRGALSACAALLLLVPSVPAFAASARPSVHLRGATAMVPAAERVAEAYMVEFPDAIVVVEGGGSRRGIKAVIDGTADVGMASSANFHDLTSAPESKVQKTLVGHGAVAVIVHPSNPVSGLSAEQLRNVLSGEIAKWSEVGGRGRDIDVCTFGGSSGDRDVVRTLVMEDRLFASGAVSIGSDSVAMRRYVASHPDAIGYVGLSYVDPSIKVLALDGVKPSAATVKDKSYLLDRELILYTRPDASEAVRKLVDYFLQPDKGQRLLAGTGVVPVAEKK